jgi:VanZ family protein
MLALRYARHWQMASIILLLLVLIAALMPAAIWFWSDDLPVVDWMMHVDKWLHGLTFVVLTVWFAGLYARRSYWRIAIGLLLFGVLIELLQGLVRYRMAEWYDLGADAIGIGVGLAIAMAGLGGWSLRFEAWREQRARQSGNE